jgi:hypothetical protein
MKQTLCFWGGISLMSVLISCKGPIISPSYRIVLPALPLAWEMVLGPPLWRLEWLAPDGRLRSREGPEAALPEADLPAEWASPVLAYPFWPDRGLLPGCMRPAGAIAPFDAEGSGLRLSWEAGPEAWFYRALAQGAAAAGSLPSDGRSPDRFNWPRFRDLLRNGDIPPEIRADPWLADWEDIAVYTVQSGFDRRRVKARPREPAAIIIPCPGPWAGASPFTEIRLWEAGETVRVEATVDADTLVSPGGVLRYNRDGVVWIPWEP